MQFKFLALASLVMSAVQALEPTDVTDQIQHITDDSRLADKAFDEVHRSFNALYAGKKGLRAIQNILVDVNDANKLLSGATKGKAEAPASRVRRQVEVDVEFSVEAQQTICGFFITFVQVHQALLATIIGDKGILDRTPLTAPIGAALRVLEGGVDNLAFGLIGLVPSCAEQARSEQAKLDNSLADAIRTYS